MERELQNSNTKKDVVVTAVEKLDGKDMVELTWVLAGAALVGLTIVCLSGSEITISKGMIKVTGKPWINRAA